MPRNAWAKVYCDLLRHPKIIGRPDSDVRLFLGLILYAKEYAPETGVVELTPGGMRASFGIKAPPKAVAQGLDYLIACGVLVRAGPHVQIRDFASRQAADSAADRQARSRDKTRDVRVTKRDGNVSNGVTETSPDVEGEVDLDPEIVARGGVRGGEPTGCESVGNSTSNSKSLTEFDKLQVQRLLAAGKAQGAQALLAQCVRNGQPTEKIADSQLRKAES